MSLRATISIILGCLTLWLPAARAETASADVRLTLIERDADPVARILTMLETAPPGVFVLYIPDAGEAAPEAFTADGLVNAGSAEYATAIRDMMQAVIEAIDTDDTFAFSADGNSKNQGKISPEGFQLVTSRATVFGGEPFNILIAAVFE